MSKVVQLANTRPQKEHFHHKALHVKSFFNRPRNTRRRTTGVETTKSMADKDRTQGNKGSDEPKPQFYDTDQIAVALKYDRKTSPAPKVVASGRGAVAEQILQLAFANDVKVRQDADLAEILSSVDVDAEIPLEAFAAVAEILAYVYRANGEKLEEQDDESDQVPSPEPKTETTPEPDSSDPETPEDADSQDNVEE